MEAALSLERDISHKDIQIVKHFHSETTYKAENEINQQEGNDETHSMNIIQPTSFSGQIPIGSVFTSYSGQLVIRNSGTL